MFDIAPSELMLVAFVALVVIGPKDLPKALRVVGYWVGRARGVARQFRSGFDSMVREAELEEMEKRWAAENERIMREHPPTPPPPEAEDYVAPVDGDGHPAAETVARPDMAPEAGGHGAPGASNAGAATDTVARPEVASASAPLSIEKPVVEAGHEPPAADGKAPS